VTVTPLPSVPPIGGAFEPDDPMASNAVDASGFGAALFRAIDDAGTSLARADAAERRFVAGTGGLQEMAVDRAQADVMLAIAGAAAARSVQALTTILGMQV
jgi:flagellar hook-basal body complex protein FliE